MKHRKLQSPESRWIDFWALLSWRTAWTITVCPDTTFGAIQREDMMECDE